MLDETHLVFKTDAKYFGASVTTTIVCMVIQIVGPAEIINLLVNHLFSVQGKK